MTPQERWHEVYVYVGISLVTPLRGVTPPVPLLRHALTAHPPHPVGLRLLHHALLDGPGLIPAAPPAQSACGGVTPQSGVTRYPCLVTLLYGVRLLKRKPLYRSPDVTK